MTPKAHTGVPLSRAPGSEDPGALGPPTYDGGVRILILGGTAHLGHAVATLALTRGWDVTCLARGTNAPPAGVRFVRADRDAEDGLAEVRAEPWDVAVDVSRQPGQVRRATESLDVRHWVFVSSANAYRTYDTLEQDETGATHPPLGADTMSAPDEYGPAKVACEMTVRAARGTATIVRLGLLTGPGDDTGRCSYYAWRFAHPTGEDVLVPDDPTMPCAFIDVDDVAPWLLHAAEQRLDGTFNVTGPTIELGEVLQLSREVAGSDLPLRPVPAAALEGAGIAPWMGPDSMPLWLPDPAWRYFATLDTTAARRHGLTTRDYSDVLARTLAYQSSLDAHPASGLTDETERTLRLSL